MAVKRADGHLKESLFVEKHHKQSQPTPAELRILATLWELGPSSVREVKNQLKKTHPAGYTTVLKLLQIMAAKGLVRRDESQRAHLYEAAVPREDTQRQLVTDLRDRGFAGSTGRLVMGALEWGSVSPEELAEVKRILSQIEEEQGGRGDDGT
jgi:BlaI family transcriptional regulator, penicillinase repressor